MRKFLAILVVLAVALALAVFLWLSARGERVPVEPGAPPAVDRSHATLQEPPALAESAATPDRIAQPLATPVASDAPTGPRCRVFGRALDVDGLPIADAGVTLYPVGGRWSETATIERSEPEPGGHERLKTTTAADGRFEFEAPLPTADWVSLDIEPDAYHELVDRQFGPAGGRDKPRIVEGDNDLGDFRLAPRGAARGRVLSVDGRRIEAARISVSGPNRGARYANTQTDAHGDYVAGHLQEGPNSLSVTAEGWIAQDGDRRRGRRRARRPTSATSSCCRRSRSPASSSIRKASACPRSP